MQRGLYAGSGSYFDRNAGCWRDFLGLNGSVVHESDGGDVQLSGNKHDADRCGGHVYGRWRRGDAFQRNSTRECNGGSYVQPCGDSPHCGEYDGDGIHGNSALHKQRSEGGVAGEFRAAEWSGVASSGVKHGRGTDDYCDGYGDGVNHWSVGDYHGVECWSASANAGHFKNSCRELHARSARRTIHGDCFERAGCRAHERRADAVDHCPIDRIDLRYRRR